MEIYHSFSDIPDGLTVSSLAVGTFDGIHLGHQKVLGKLCGTSAVITFTNHPYSVLHPESDLKALCSLDSRISFLERHGIDIIIAIPFTHEIANLSAEAFLAMVQKRVSFSTLVVGYDAHIGHGNSCSKEALHLLGLKLGVSVVDVDALCYDGLPISSSRIRVAIQSGDLGVAEIMLGRRYSLRSTVVKGKGMGSHLGYKTANFDIAGLCHPPCGVYAITATIDGEKLHGIANIGTAPTIKSLAQPILEVHFFEEVGALYGEDIEIAIKEFIREEKRFESVAQLQQQISCDIELSKDLGIRSRISELQ
ncbi:MAG: bifunctional riboflavin kinase/FAD synthetase [Waddliaceae bacterium]|nr:bifunctional riboflavin kinase/FAD synthetase [Waddliaceae bacterium]MBT3579109.1 bifunctional riboflavin kinase/FAD synthetase [Waddliaceae bacterium]MBT4445476.1 bifunctional riboflavin kinase/FAD synthetase [Waddliaceae bacterium]MBT6927945.1 bifunctional riboflavin kinase/FAD synthetase [Waddliaceae bacterium]MBT7264597.1 bifunctional riboflavin kinase/FAD synthetase [Waddliaceae bacterium]